MENTGNIEFSQIIIASKYRIFTDSWVYFYCYIYIILQSFYRYAIYSLHTHTYIYVCIFIYISMRTRVIATYGLFTHVLDSWAHSVNRRPSDMGLWGGDYRINGWDIAKQRTHQISTNTLFYSYFGQSPFLTHFFPQFLSLLNLGDPPSLSSVTASARLLSRVYFSPLHIVVYFHCGLETSVVFVCEDFRFWNWCVGSMCVPLHF